ncbi:MAG: recombination regulator RecX [Endomicrobia bacterium]|nr:recombination regulator RecX [Endomicrobiia bacterium]MCX7940547.1 recombination regulator RecX [Endomicrobiia bacterium]MDW8056032.1 regulatory protein RecX [Elusimicrobiota bacterium]
MFKKDKFEEIFNYCCKLLKIKERSVYEIKERLIKQGVDNKTISEVINKLINNGYLSEERFVCNYIERNLMKGKSLSLIIDLLKDKYKVQNETLGKINLQEYKEKQIYYVTELVKKKYKTFDMQKIYKFLKFRGFNEEEIEGLISFLKREYQ